MMNSNLTVSRSRPSSFLSQRAQQTPPQPQGPPLNLTLPTFLFDSSSIAQFGASNTPSLCLSNSGINLSFFATASRSALSVALNCHSHGDFAPVF